MGRALPEDVFRCLQIVIITPRFRSTESKARMNKPLSKMFQIFSGRSRSEKTDLMLSRYCTCGALKPEPVTQEGGPSLNNQEQQLPGYSADARFADGVGTYASPVRSRTNRY